MKFWSAAILCAFALPAGAEPWQCRMVLECYEQEACAPTQYDLELGAIENRYLMSDIGGERPMTEVAVLDEPDLRAFVSMIQDISVQLLSIYPDGSAHLSVHVAGEPPFMVTYRGTCEGEP